MSSVSGLSSSTVNDLRGYGGLASGLDRDSLIEGMTYATQSKIASQNQKKDLLEWEMNAIRGITTSMYDFSNKYMSFASNTNLLGSTIFGRNSVTAEGENSKYLSVTGSNVSSSTFSVLGVKSLAENASATTSAASDKLIQTGAISTDLGTTLDLNTLEGNTMYIKYGDTNYAVTLSTGDGYDYSDTDAVINSINKAMSEIEVEGGKKLSDIVQMGKVGEGSAERFTLKDVSSDGNRVEIAGGTGNILQNLGFVPEGTDFDDFSDALKQITTGSGLVAGNAATLTQESSLATQFSGAKMVFEYNGTTSTITLGSFTSDSTIKDVQEDLQDQLDDAFGKGRVTVDLTGADGDAERSLSFRTTIPNATGDNTDTTSTLSIVSADSSMLGNHGILGIKAGETNRVNVNASIAESGLNRDVTVPADGSMVISNNGEVFDLAAAGLSWDSSVDEIMDAINENEDLGIKITYQKQTDKFIIESTEQGASGQIDLGGNVAEALFGEAGVDYTVNAGKDAVMSVKYDGSDEIVEISRGTNTITVDGMSVTVKGEFGYVGDTLDTTTEAVTFNAEVDTDAAADAVKSMIEDFNKILETVNSQLSTKRDYDYAPLTDEQRDEMSETEIENWEEKAQEGLLFGDSDLRALSNDLRFSLPLSMREALSDIGITVSSDYTENGKLIFDENAFKAALAENPEKVTELFTAEETTNADGTINPAGFIVTMQETMDKYAGMTGVTKGVLVERAGSIYSPTTITDNAMQTQIDDIDSILDTLADRLETETDRYISQFTQLETLISEMNSQSSYLTSMFSY